MTNNFKKLRDQLNDIHSYLSHPPTPYTHYLSIFYVSAFMESSCFCLGCICLFIDVWMAFELFFSGCLMILSLYLSVMLMWISITLFLSSLWPLIIYVGYLLMNYFLCFFDDGWFSLEVWSIYMVRRFILSTVEVLPKFLKIPPTPSQFLFDDSKGG